MSISSRHSLGGVNGREGWAKPNGLVSVTPDVEVAELGKEKDPDEGPVGVVVEG